MVASVPWLLRFFTAFPATSPSAPLSVPRLPAELLVSVGGCSCLKITMPPRRSSEARGMRPSARRPLKLFMLCLRPTHPQVAILLMFQFYRFGRVPFPFSKNFVESSSSVMTASVSRKITLPFGDARCKKGAAKCAAPRLPLGSIRSSDRFSVRSANPVGGVIGLDVVVAVERTHSRNYRFLRRDCWRRIRPRQATQTKQKAASANEGSRGGANTLGGGGPSSRGDRKLEVFQADYQARRVRG